MRRADLAASDVEAMEALLSRHFHGVDDRTFRADLDDKNWVVLLEDGSGCLRGFSTFRIYGTEAAGRSLAVVYSGDTIVDPEVWGSPALPRTWIQALREARRDFPGRECVWLLLTSGFRTYRFLSVFLRDFHPRFDVADRPDRRRLLDELCRERFGDRWDPIAGVVRFERPQRLRERLAGVPEGRLSNPHVGFFLERNPGHAAGDELASLASLDEANLTAVAGRMARRTAQGNPPW